MTNQTKFSMIVGVADGTVALLFGVPVGAGILLGVEAYVVCIVLFALDAAGKLFKE